MRDRVRPSCRGLCIGLSLAAPFALVPARAQLAQAQISGLSDIALGTIGTAPSDITRTQTVCAYSSGLLGQYHVTATGGGPGFVLKSAAGGALPYEVQWNQSANAASGTALTSGVALTGQTTQTLFSNCALNSSGTLIVIARAAALSAASAGDYSGTLTLLLAPN